MATQIQHRWMTASIALLLVIAGIYTLHRGWTVGVEYFDGYIYLTNAARLAGGDHARFDPIRPPLLSLIHAPVVAAARTLGPANEWLMRGPHLLSAVLSLLSLTVVFFVFRGIFGTTLALFGALIFAGSRYFARYGPHVMTDIPVAALTLAAVALYIRARIRGTRTGFVLCGVIIGLAMLMKYTALAVLPALVLAELALLLRKRLAGLHADMEDKGGKPIIFGLVTAGVVAGLVTVIVLLSVFFAVYGPALWTSLPAAAREVAGFVGDNATESWTDHLAMAAVMFSVPLLLLAGAGLVVACLNLGDRDVFFLCYLLVIGGGIVAFVGHTEARYLLPSIPALIYFILRGVEKALLALEASYARSGRPPGVIILLLAVTMLAVATQNGLRQALADSEPFFSADTQRRASETLLASRGESGRFWALGRWHTLIPSQSRAGPMPEDEFWNMFHTTPLMLEYFLGERIGLLPVPNASATQLKPLLGNVLRDGDAVVRLEGRLLTTKTIHAGVRVQPLEVWSIASLDLARTTDGNALASKDGKATVTLIRVSQGTHIEFSQSLGVRDVYLTLRSEPRRQFIGTFDVQAGSGIELPAVDTDLVTSLVFFDLTEITIE